MELELIQIFVQVIKSCGFSKAALVLKIPKSTVSKSIARLEDETGTKLLIRTTRSQQLTPAGKVLYECCAGPLEEIENAQKSLYGNDNVLTGSIRLTAPEDLGSEIIAPAAGELARRYPGLNFELFYTNEIVDLINQRFDLAIRIGKLNESSLKIKKIGEVKLILIASPNYLKSAAKILKLEDLKEHDCLALGGDLRKCQWSLRTNTTSAHVSIRPRIVSNQMSSLLKAALSGSGIALVPAYLARPFLDSKSLIRVLPQWVSFGLQVSMLSPLAFSSSARLRLVADHFSVVIRNALEVD